jgi:hypothetical protein
MVAARKPQRRPFSRTVLAAIDESGFLKIRAGTVHRFIGIWAVVVGGRVFVRSWNNKENGWQRALMEEGRGSIQIGERTVRIRPRQVRGVRLFKAIEAGYAAKYQTPASRYYVQRFKTPRRRRSTTELLPL